MDYEVFIDGVKLGDIKKGIQITDRQGAKADDIRLFILNDENLIVKRGSMIECSFGGFSSGKMNVDTISSNSTTTQIGAISAPLSAKIKHTRHWLKVRFFDIVNDVAVNNGLSVYYQGVTNYYYENVTQFKETDLAFLNRLCEREGYSLKIDNNRLVVYSNEIVEKVEPVKKIGFNDVVDQKISFSQNPNRVTAVTVKHYSNQLIAHTAIRGTGGEEVVIREYVADIDEAKRFSENYLASLSQNDTTVDCFIPITDGIAAGNCVEFVDYAMFNGKYLIFECSHDPEKNQTRLRGRRV